MEYREPQGWNEPPEECKPRYDSEGEAHNCAECSDNTCEFYDEYNEKE